VCELLAFQFESEQHLKACPWQAADIFAVCLVEDPVTRQYKPRNHVERLEERIAALEKELQQYRSTTQPAIPHDDESAGEWWSYSDTAQTSESLGAPADTDIDDLVSKVGLLGLNAGGAEPHYLGSTSAFSFARIISSTLRGFHNQPTTINRHPTSHETSNFPSVLPDYNAAIALSNAYFDNIHPQYPFLHEQTFRTWEVEALASSGPNTTTSPVALYFLYMVSQACRPPLHHSC
jgi:hypothetical protein